MKVNTVKVGKWTLTLSMAALCLADQELRERNKKTVLETFNLLLPLLLAFRSGQLRDMDVSFDGIDFEAFSVAIWCFLRPHHDDLSFEEALSGPLGDGLPQDWLSALFKLVDRNTPKGKKTEGKKEAA